MTKYSPQFTASGIVFSLSKQKREPSAAVAERSALLHVWVPPLHRHAEEDYVYSMLVWWRLVLGGTPIVLDYSYYTIAQTFCQCEQNPKDFTRTTYIG